MNAIVDMPVFENTYHISPIEIAPITPENRHTRCDELDERSAREIVIFALFGFFTQQIVPFMQRTYTYIGKIDNGWQSSIQVTRSVEVNR